ncbi:MAG TPA: glycosyltransferase [Gemmatimonadales bacterium]
MHPRLLYPRQRQVQPPRAALRDTPEAPARLILHLFTLLAFASLAEALLSLKRGADWLALFRKHRDLPAANPDIPTTLIVPFRGVDTGMEENLRAFFRLDYRDLEILLVTGDSADASVPLLERLRADHPKITSKLLFAGAARSRGQKVHNLLHALGHVRNESRVVAFADSDGRPAQNWLKHLVGGLADPRVGVTTGYRWYVPRRGNAASVLRSIWNASIATLLDERAPAFAWGGAMALRKETLERARIAGYWEGALSDDYAVTRAVRDQGLLIRFEPRCLVFSHEDCGWRDLLGWSFRQLAITRVYQPGLWWRGWISELLGGVTFWCGLAVAGASALSGAGMGEAALLAGLILVAWGVRAAKGWLRLEAVETVFPAEGHLLRRYRAAYLLWGPLASLVTLLGLIRSALTRKLVWRGVRYRMVSPTQTVVTEGAP